MNTSQDSRSFQPTKALFCLGAATLFWLLSALNKPSYTLNIEYPVQFIYNDSLYIPTAPLPRMVRVNVSGDGWSMLKHSWLPFRIEPVNYVVNHPLQDSVINTTSLASALTDHIKKLRVNYVVADTLDLHFDRRLTKTIHLVADSLHISLAPRYIVSSIINVTPHTIQVSGPDSLLRGFPDTLQVRIPRKGIAENYDEQLPIIQLRRYPLLHSNANRVDVSFEVGELLSPN